MSKINSSEEPDAQASANNVTVGNLSIGGNMQGNITIGNTTGYSADDVSALLKDISSTFQPKPFEGRCPYKGLDVFEEEDAELFFGREKLVDELVRRGKESRTVFITGPSGSGKSSLVRAGLIPALKQGRVKGGDRWLYATMKPGRDPFEALAGAFSRLKSPELGTYFREHSHEPAVLSECAESVLSERKDQRLVLFIDQFEEVFTQVSKEEERLVFLNLLTHAADADNGRVILLFSMRSDFVPNCAVYPKLNATLNRQFIQIGAMQPDELVSAIAQPALRVGLRIDPDLIAQIINDMKGEPGALPLMSFALKDLFDKEQAKGGLIALTLSRYLENKGVNEALQRHADAALAQLNEHEKKLAQSIFSNLIEIGRGTQDTKRTALFDELIPADSKSDDVKAVVQKLADARLVTTEEDSNKYTITHEKLIDAWPWLKRLINENRDAITLQNEIASAAKEWEENKRDASYLYSGGRLANIWEQVQKQKLVLGQLAEEFVKAGRRKQQRTRAAFFSAVSLVLIASIVASVLFQNQAKRAQINANNAATAEYVAYFEKNSAEEQKKIALAGQLAAQAQALHENELQLSLLMGIEAYNTADTKQSQAMLLSNIQNPAELIGFFGYQGDSVDGPRIAMSPDGKVIATGGENHSIILWDVENRKPIGKPLTENTGFITNLSFSPDGKMLASAAQFGAIYLWDTQTYSSFSMFYSGSSIIDKIAFSPNGEILAASGNDQVITLWEIKTGAVIAQISTGNFLIGSNIIFSPDGKWFIATPTVCDYASATTVCSSKVSFFDPQTFELKMEVNGNIGTTTDIAISADSKSLAVSGKKGVDIWNLDADPSLSATLHQDYVLSLGISPDGRTLAIGSDKIIFWDIESLIKSDQELIGHSAIVTSLRFSPDGKKLASGGCNFNSLISYEFCDKGETMLWDLTENNPIVTQLDTGIRLNLVLSSPAGDYQVINDQEKFTFWAVSQNTQIGNLKDCPDTSPIFTFDKNGNHIAEECQSDGKVYIWTTSPFELVATLQMTDLKNFAFSWNNKLIVTRQEDQIRLWDVSTSQPVGSPTSVESDQWKYLVEFSPNGEYFTASSCNTNDQKMYCEPKILIWDTQTQTLLHELTVTGQAGVIRAITFNSNGNILVSGGGGNGVMSGDSSIIFWDTTTGKPIGQPLKPLRVVILDIDSLSLSPDDSILVSSDEAAHVILWDMSTLQEIGRLQTNSVNDYVHFTKGGNLITNGYSGPKLWDLSPQKWIEIACQRAGRNFTRTEWSVYFPNEEYRKTCEQWPLESEVFITPTATP